LLNLAPKHSNRPHCELRKAPAYVNIPKQWNGRMLGKWMNFSGLWAPNSTGNVHSNLHWHFSLLTVGKKRRRHGHQQQRRWVRQNAAANSLAIALHSEVYQSFIKKYSFIPPFLFKDEIQRHQWLNCICLNQSEYLPQPLIQL